MMGPDGYAPEIALLKRGRSGLLNKRAASSFVKCPEKTLLSKAGQLTMAKTFPVLTLATKTTPFFLLYLLKVARKAASAFFVRSRSILNTTLLPFFGFFFSIF